MNNIAKKENYLPNLKMNGQKLIIKDLIKQNGAPKIINDENQGDLPSVMQT